MKSIFEKMDPFSKVIKNFLQSRTTTVNVQIQKNGISGENYPILFPGVPLSEFVRIKLILRITDVLIHICN